MIYYAHIDSKNKLVDIDMTIFTADEYGSENVQNIEVPEEYYINAQEYGTNYYKYSDGEVILNPDYEQEQEEKERERIAKLKLTKREVFLALYRDKEITPEMIKAQITNPEAMIEFEYASDYFRGNPLIDTIGALLGYTSADLDYLFEHKEFPPHEAEE